MGELAESSQRIPTSSEQPEADDNSLAVGPSTPIRDVEGAVEAFSTAGVDLRVDRLQDPGAFSLEIAVIQMGVAELVSTKWGTDNWLRVELPGQVAVVVNPFRGTPSLFTTSGESIGATMTTAPILQPQREVKIFRPANSPVWVLSAHVKYLERLFREITGSDRGGLDFESGLNRESPEGRRFQRLIDFTLEELRANPSAVDNPIIRRQLNDAVLGGMLLLPGKHHRFLMERSTSFAGSAVVRRAEEFMEAHADCPIGMSDVAAACDCSRTKLFLAFKKERPWTPLQFLVRQRMERARRLLLAPARGVTVTRVALDCGYASLSRFTQEYRKLYGETPSVTLSRSR